MFSSWPEFLEILVIVPARILRFRQSSWQDPKGDSQIAGEVDPDRRPGVSRRLRAVKSTRRSNVQEWVWKAGYPESRRTWS